VGPHAKGQQASQIRPSPLRLPDATLSAAARREPPPTPAPNQIDPRVPEEHPAKPTQPHQASRAEATRPCRPCLATALGPDPKESTQFGTNPAGH